MPIFYIVLYSALCCAVAFAVIVLTDNYLTNRRIPKVSYRSQGGTTATLHQRIEARQREEEAIAAFQRAEAAYHSAQSHA